MVSILYTLYYIHVCSWSALDCFFGDLINMRGGVSLFQEVRLGRPQAREVLTLVGRIGVIVFTVELLIMATLMAARAGAPFDWDVLLDSVIDATALTVISSPMIYRWVAEPFVSAANGAKAALAEKITAQTEQAAQLEIALQELRQLLEQNEDLRRNLEQSSRSVAEINEQLLQRISSDLHDGPAQMLAYSLLRLSKLGALIDANSTGKDKVLLQEVSNALSDTLLEVRSISSGLSTPHLAGATLAETLLYAVTWHEEHSRTKVMVSLDDLPAAVPEAIKICAYRFVQEGLTNAYRHAKASGQRVTASCGDELVIVVSDNGPGLDPTLSSQSLGLKGMKARIEATGGRLKIAAIPGSGTRLTATFQIGIAADE